MKVYKDTTTGEIWSEEEVRQAFEQVKYEMIRYNAVEDREELRYNTFDEYLEDKLSTGALEEVEKVEDQETEYMLENWNVTAAYMDDEIREQIHAELAPCTEEEFLEAYKAAHLAKFGEEFRFN